MQLATAIRGWLSDTERRRLVELLTEKPKRSRRRKAKEPNAGD